MERKSINIPEKALDPAARHRENNIFKEAFLSRKSSTLMTLQH